jgi:hypothetical protein
MFPSRMVENSVISEYGCESNTDSINHWCSILSKNKGFSSNLIFINLIKIVLKKFCVSVVVFNSCTACALGVKSN